MHFDTIMTTIDTIMQFPYIIFTPLNVSLTNINRFNYIVNNLVTF